MARNDKVIKKVSLKAFFINLIIGFTFYFALIFYYELHRSLKFMVLDFFSSHRPNLYHSYFNAWNIFIYYVIPIGLIIFSVFTAIGYSRSRYLGKLPYYIYFGVLFGINALFMSDLITLIGFILLYQFMLIFFEETIFNRTYTDNGKLYLFHLISVVPSNIIFLFSMGLVPTDLVSIIFLLVALIGSIFLSIITIAPKGIGILFILALFIYNLEDFYLIQAHLLFLYIIIPLSFVTIVNDVNWIKYYFNYKFQLNLENIIDELGIDNIKINLEKSVIYPFLKDLDNVKRDYFKYIKESKDYKKIKNKIFFNNLKRYLKYIPSVRFYIDDEHNNIFVFKRELENGEN
ncbi:MAG: hypothetical protein ACTSVV_10915 [Promethearchaeota archaeon]